MASIALTTRHPVRRMTPMQRYLVALFIGAALTLATFAGTLIGLKSVGSLPPPQLSNSICIDEKLHSMRESPPASPDLLVVGSSVAWRHFNGATAQAVEPGISPFNAGFCGAKMSQVGLVTGWLTTRLPSVRHVVLIASPFDFEGCTRSDPSQFDVKEADAYVFGDGAPATYYARYFDPITLIGNARSIKSSRSSMTVDDPLFQDAYGDAPMEPSWSRGLFYERATLDPACFAALRQNALRLQRKGIAFDVTLMPMHPEWSRRYAGPAFRRMFAKGLQTSLAGTGARYHVDWYAPAPDSYFDAMHIRWSATDRFTRTLLDVTRSPEEQTAAASAGRSKKLAGS